MKLYFAPQSRAVRTAWLLEEIGLDYELHNFTLGTKEMRSEPYLSINPMGRVPVLEDGEVIISESTAIAQYLVARHGGGDLAPAPDSPDFPAYLQWMHYAEGMIMPSVNIIVVETILLPPERRNQGNADRAMKLLNRALAGVEAHMGGREFLAGGFSAADTITGHACIISAQLGADMSDKPNIAAYNARLLERPALKKALSL